MPTPAARPPKLTGMILAGGQARRMEGQDKGLVRYQGRPLIDHVLQRLKPQVDGILINANRNADEYGKFGCPVVADAEQGFLGPLAGMLAGLRAAQTELLLCVPCDSPQIHAELAARLMASFDKDPSTQITVASCGGRLQPVFAALRVELADSLEAFLKGGGRKIDQFYAEHNFVEVAFEDMEAFRNINTPEELAHSA